MEKFNQIVILLIIFASCLFGEIIFGYIAFVLASVEAISLYLLFPLVIENLKERAKANKDKKIERLEKQLNDLKTEVV